MTKAPKGWVKEAADRAEGARSVGRPTKYDPEYCELVIEAAKQGLSLTAFAGMLEVSRDTISEWVSVHPEFSAAVRAHKAVRTLALETGLLSAEQGPRVTARIFALKNAAPEEWKDRQTLEHTGADGGPIQTADLTKLDEDGRAALRLAVEQITGRGE